MKFFFMDGTFIGESNATIIIVVKVCVESPFHVRHTGDVFKYSSKMFVGSAHTGQVLLASRIF